MISFTRFGSDGLGNQLFRYAFLRTTALRLGVKFYCQSWGGDKFFLLNDSDEKAEHPDNIDKYYEEPDNFGFNESALRIKDGTDIHGYFQTEKYFIGQPVKNWYTFKEDRILSVKEKYKHIDFSQAVGIHLRFGDMKSLLQYVILPVEYFLKALSLVRRKKYILVFSDEIELAKKWLKSLRGNIIYIEGNKAYEDLFLMTQCHDFVCSISTLSWWGAWLNDQKDKTIVAPREWIRPGYVKWNNDINCKDWLQIRTCKFFFDDYRVKSFTIRARNAIEKRAAALKILLSNIKHKSPLVRNSYWQLNYFLKFGRLKYNNSNLRIVVGCSRSGTNWIANILSQTSTPIRFIYEPLFHFEPRLILNRGLDHTGMDYQSQLSRWHPLSLTYSLLGSNFNSWDGVFYKPGLSRKIIARNDTNWKYTLIKEVHTLLITEALLNTLKCKAILVIRNPIMVADSIFKRDKLEGICVEFEKTAVFSDRFLIKYSKAQKTRIQSIIKDVKKNENKRLQMIIIKTLTVALINKMMKSIANVSKNVVLITYEDLLSDPISEFKKLYAFMSFQWDDSIADYIFRLSNNANEKHLKDPHRLERNLEKQKNKKCSFITEKEQEILMEYLSSCDLL